MASYSVFVKPLSGCQTPAIPAQSLIILMTVLVCAFCSILCYGDIFTDMENIGQTKLSWLPGFMILEHGAPSYEVFRNVFMMQWTQAVLEQLSSWGRSAGSAACLHRRQDAARHP